MSSHLAQGKQASNKEHYLAGDLLVEVDTLRAFRNDQEIHLPKMSFEVLVTLLRYAPEVVSREQLMSEVWTGLVVEPDTVSKRITLLRESLEDTKQQNPLIRAVRGRGYSINIPVEKLDDAIPNKKLMQTWRPGVLASFLIITIGLLALFGWQQFGNNKDEDKTAPSIAVLPFSFESNQVAPFFTELSNELSRQLQKSGQIRLASSDAIDAVPDLANVSDAAAQLGVRYVLDGVLGMKDGNLTLSVAMFDSETEGEIWTKNFQETQLQETTNIIANSVLTEVGVEPLNLNTKLFEPKAYELYLQARRHWASTNLSVDAERLYREAIDIDPQLSPAYAGLCSFLVSRYFQVRTIQDFEEAERHCHRAWTIDAHSIEVRLALAQLYYHAGQTEKSREMFEKILAANPDNYFAQNWLIITYFDENPGLSEVLIKRLIRQNPGSPEAYNTLGGLYLNQGRYAEALEQQRWVVRLRPSEETKRALAGNLSMAGLFSEAKTLALTMLESDSEKTGKIHNILGFILFYEGDYTAAAKQFAEGVDRAPEDPFLRRNLGDAIWHLEGQGAAEPIFRNVIQLGKRQLEINPHDHVMKSNLMVAYSSVGNSDHFQSYKDTLLELQAAERDPYTHYDIAVAASRLGDMQTARQHAEKARELGFSLAMLRADPDIAASGVSFD